MGILSNFRMHLFSKRECASPFPSSSSVLHIHNVMTGQTRAFINHSLVMVLADLFFHIFHHHHRHAQPFSSPMTWYLLRTPKRFDLSDEICWARACFSGVSHAPLPGERGPSVPQFLGTLILRPNGLTKATKFGMVSHGIEACFYRSPTPPSTVGGAAASPEIFGPPARSIRNSNQIL